MEHSGPPLSVVVVTYRNAATLPGVLAALKRDAPPGTELVIVENGGDAAIEAVVRAAWPDAVVTVNAQNRGFAAGVNQGVKRTTGQSILLLNPDAEVGPGAIEALQAALARLRTPASSRRACSTPRAIPSSLPTHSSRRSTSPGATSSSGTSCRTLSPDNSAA